MLETPSHSVRTSLTFDNVLYHTFKAKSVGRTMAATDAIDQGADIAKVQEWLGHASVSTTRVYYHRKSRPEDSPVFKVSY